MTETVNKIKPSTRGQKCSVGWGTRKDPQEVWTGGGRGECQVGQARACLAIALGGVLETALYPTSQSCSPKLYMTSPPPKRGDRWDSFLKGGRMVRGLCHSHGSARLVGAGDAGSGARWAHCSAACRWLSCHRLDSSLSSCVRWAHITPRYKDEGEGLLGWQRVCPQGKMETASPAEVGSPCFPLN